MVFRHESPIAGICGIVSVVSHHPVIVHTESVGVGFLTVDIYIVVANFQCIAFVIFDNAGLKAYIVVV